ncbi:MAG TPA: biliverdin-producing heme oxygenase [Chitinophagaceae bacterium]
MIAENLKEATNESHAALEKLVIAKIRQTNSSDRYLHLLEMFYGFYKPVEEQIDSHIDRAHFTDYSQRRKSEALLQDMHNLEAGSRLMLCQDLPSISDSVSCLGALYVLEGSTLGGSVISKLLKKELGDEAPEFFLFFNCYGDSARDMWYEFKEKLNSYTTNEAAHLKMIEAANETFVKFKTWILEYERN